MSGEWIPPRLGGAVDDDDPLSWPRAVGAMYGKLWGDPIAMAQAEGITVRFVTESEMCALRGARPGVGRLVAGLYYREEWPQKPTFHVLSDLPRREQLLTVAHELAHVHHSTWGEPECEQFARAFAVFCDPD